MRVRRVNVQWLLCLPWERRSEAPFIGSCARGYQILLGLATEGLPPEAKALAFARGFRNSVSLRIQYAIGLIMLDRVWLASQAADRRPA